MEVTKGRKLNVNRSRMVRACAIVLLGGLGWVVVASSALIDGLGTVWANPSTTVSRYTGGTGASSTSDFYSLGCNRASAAAGTVVLAFGAPKYDSYYGWGVDPPGYASFWTINEVKDRAKQFAAGVYACRSSSTNIAMVLGTSNDNVSYGGVQYSSGYAWAGMVKDVQAYVTAGTDWSPWVNAYAGNDVEPDFSTAYWVREWYRGYGDVSSARRVYDFGSADGCPQSYYLSGGVYLSGQTSSPGSCNNSWTQDDVYYVSWGFTLAYSIPGIYANFDSSGAFSPQSVQWERFVRYANLRYSRSMSISGVLTQYTACSEVGCPSNEDNTPTQGYDQLWNSLQYIDSGSGAQSPGWLTDISWNQ